MYLAFLFDSGEDLDVRLRMEGRKLGAIFRISGLMAAADTQKRPVFTSTELQIAMS
jgi:hypothetical protein